MIEKPKLGLYLDLLIERPENSEQLRLIAAAIPETFNYIQSTSAKHKLAIRRQGCICAQTAVLVRYTDKLYLEWRYQGTAVLARALILLLQLIQQLNVLIPATCQKLSLPKVLLDRACSKYRNSRDRLEAGLAAQGVSAELIALALLPPDQLMKREGMAYKRFDYILQHLRVLRTLNSAGESPERADEILCEKLVRINYNNLQFIGFCISGFKNSLYNMPGPSMQRKFIRTQKKYLAGLEVESAFVYDSCFVAARTALMKWLREEQMALKRAY